MEDIDFSIIHNNPEGISGVGWKAHFIGLGLFIVLFICAIPCILVDSTWIKNSVEMIVSAGIIVTLGMSFIFILCPTYFLLRFIMEIFRTIKNKHKFYSTPNIKYIKLNNDNIFFKNTCENYDFAIKKSDVVKVILNGEVKTSFSGYKVHRKTTYLENVTMTIKTDTQNYIIYNPTFRLKQIKTLDIRELIQQQILFYKSYFKNFVCLIDMNKLK